MYVCLNFLSNIFNLYSISVYFVCFKLVSFWGLKILAFKVFVQFVNMPQEIQNWILRCFKKVCQFNFFFVTSIIFISIMPSNMLTLLEIIYSFIQYHNHVQLKNGVNGFCRTWIFLPFGRGYFKLNIFKDTKVTTDTIK